MIRMISIGRSLKVLHAKDDLDVNIVTLPLSEVRLFTNKHCTKSVAAKIIYKNRMHK